jgi:release factor glutamine methyltransferase
MTIKSLLDTATAKLSMAGIGSARLDAELLMAHVLEQNRAYVIAHSDDRLPKTATDLYLLLIDKRSARTPLVHLTNHREFYGLTLVVDDTVLTPRVETEQMAAWAIELAPRSSRLIDIGTGSGAIALAIATHRPDLTVVATEVSEAALETAGRNAATLGLNTEFVRSDLFESVDGYFETVVTNLPYLQDGAELMPEVAKEPAVALFGGPGDGLDLYRRFLSQLPSHLSPGGLLFTECDPWQQPDLIAEAQSIGLSVIKQDYFILGFSYAG